MYFTRSGRYGGQTLNFEFQKEFTECITDYSINYNGKARINLSMQHCDAVDIYIQFVSTDWPMVIIKAVVICWFCTYKIQCCKIELVPDKRNMVITFKFLISFKYKFMQNKTAISEKWRWCKTYWYECFLGNCKVIFLPSGTFIAAPSQMCNCNNITIRGSQQNFCNWQ